MPRVGPSRGKIQEHSVSENAPKSMRTEEALRNIEERWRSVFRMLLLALRSPISRATYSS